MRGYRLRTVEETTVTRLRDKVAVDNQPFRTLQLPNEQRTFVLKEFFFFNKKKFPK